MNSMMLAELGLPKRVPARPVELRQPNFDDFFDFDTLFYDVMISESGLLFICPPLDEDMLYALISKTKINGKVLETFNPSIFQSQKVSKIIVDISGEVEDNIHVDVVDKKIILQSFKPITDKKRVLYTLQKDNNIDWIKGYVNWYIKTQGIECVIIYDNNSTVYTSLELQNALNSLDCEVIVTSFNFPYGPVAALGSSWDSDLCQYGAFEHVRYRLSKDVLLFNFDIDELLISDFISGENDKRISFCGRWAFLDDKSSGEVIHNTHSILDKEVKCSKKWVVNLSSIPQSAFLQVHNLYGINFDSDRENEFYIHFRSANNSWQYKRSDGLIFDSEQHYLLNIDTDSGKLEYEEL